MNSVHITCMLLETNGIKPDLCTVKKKFFFLWVTLKFENKYIFFFIYKPLRRFIIINQ